MNSRVLFVTYYWPPSGGAGVQRTLKFAKYLPEYSIQPFILTVENPTYPIIDASLTKDIPDTVTVFRSKTLEPFSLYSKWIRQSVEDSTKPTIELSSGKWKTRLGAWIRANFFIPDARAGWLMTVRSKAVSIIKDYNIDTIITTGPPHSVHFAGKYAKKKTGIRWIADFRDPWSAVYYNRLMPRTCIAKKIDEKMERSILRQADEVIVISASMAKVQRSVYDREYHVITNGFDPRDFKNGPKKLGDNRGVKKIRFIGSVREGAIPDSFLKAVQQLANHSSLIIEFIGNSHPALEQLIDDLELNEIVKILPYVPHEEAVRAMQTADLLLLSISKTPKSDLILTGKLFEYLGSGTPILFLGSTTGEAATVIRETGQGVCFDYGETGKIHDFLVSFLQGKLTFKNFEVHENHPYSRNTLTRELTRLL